VIGSLRGSGAALARSSRSGADTLGGRPASAGPLLAALGAGTAVASLVAGRAAGLAPAALERSAAALALAAVAAPRFRSTAPWRRRVGRRRDGARRPFVTLYMLVDELTPRGAARARSRGSSRPTTAGSRSGRAAR
jgi:hypothetical protein